MSEVEKITSTVRQIGFRCRRCGECCQGNGLRVMVYPEEVRAIALHSGRSWREVAEPYPEEVVLPSGTKCSFEWALRITDGRCLFLEDGRCQVYPVRPWICRTYPFVLEGSSVQQSACPGVGDPMEESDACLLAQNLIGRREAEEKEEERVRENGRDLEQVRARHILVDGEGVKILEA
jgi:Fe-S-cluster containining protein